MAMLTDDWLEAVQEEFHKPYYKELYQFVTAKWLYILLLTIYLMQCILPP